MKIDENGLATVKTDLPIGSYYVKEIATDEHYILNSDKYEFAFEYEGQEIVAVTLSVNGGKPIENDLIYGSVEGMKTTEHGDSLAGAVIGLFKKDETNFTKDTALMTTTSAEDGSFSFANIPYGEWVVREIEQPMILQMLEAAEYEIKKGKNISVRGKDQKRFIRLSSLPEGYHEADIRNALDGKTPMPARKPPRQEKKVDLLIDIQAMLQSKGAGYARWAKKFNLKQMSQTLLFLRDKGLDSIEDLDAAAAAGVAKRDALLADIKKVETRLVEIGVLKKHIVNYSKTRAVYEEYRRSGYSKRFLEEHREAITLHKAAKKAFDELGVKKIPKVKDLSAEYAQVLTDKKRMYAEYRQVRDEVQELLIAQRNIATLYTEDHADEENQKKKATKDR